MEGKKLLENLIHIPIYASCWILDTASAALTCGDFQGLQWMNEIRDQRFLPKPGISAIVCSLSNPLENLYFHFYIIFILTFILYILM